MLNKDELIAKYGQAEFDRLLSIVRKEMGVEEAPLTAEETTEIQKDIEAWAGKTPTNPTGISSIDAAIVAWSKK